LVLIFSLILLSCVNSIDFNFCGEESYSISNIYKLNILFIQECLDKNVCFDENERLPENKDYLVGNYFKYEEQSDSALFCFENKLGQGKTIQIKKGKGDEFSLVFREYYDTCKIKFKKNDPTIKAIDPYLEQHNFFELFGKAYKQIVYFYFKKLTFPSMIEYFVRKRLMLDHIYMQKSNVMEHNECMANDTNEESDILGKLLVCVKKLETKPKIEKKHSYVFFLFSELLSSIAVNKLNEYTECWKNVENHLKEEDEEEKSYEDGRKVEKKYCADTKKCFEILKLKTEVGKRGRRFK
jgi:hypothetical protein